MVKEKEQFKRWVKDHKKTLICAGLSIAAIIGIIFLIKDKKTLIRIWNELKRKIEKNTKTVSIVSCQSKRIIESVNCNDVKQSVQVARMTTDAADIADIAPFKVSRHVRKLPKGQHASSIKISTAAENGIKLSPDYTWVETYTKYKKMSM